MEAGLIKTDFQNRLKVHADDGFTFVFVTKKKKKNKKRIDKSGMVFVYSFVY